MHRPFLHCFSRPSLSVQGSTIRPVISTKNLHSVGCSCPGSSSVTRDQDPAISGQLGNLCSRPRTGDSEQDSVPGVHCELEEEQSQAQTAGGFPRSTVQFLDNGGMSYSSENREPEESNKSILDKEVCVNQQSPEAIRHNSSGIDSNSLRSVKGTPYTMVVQLFSSSSDREPEEEAVCVKGMHVILNSLEE